MRSRDAKLCAVAKYVAVLGCMFLSFGMSAQTKAGEKGASAEAEIRAADAAWVKAAQTKKVDAWMAFYAPGAVALPPNEKTASTREEISKSVAAMLGLPDLSISWKPTKVEVAKSGDIGYLYGTYLVSFSDPSKKKIQDHGKMVEIWKKQPDGKWKCVVDMWSSNGPATP